MAKLNCSYNTIYNIISTNSSKFYKDIEEKIKNNLAIQPQKEIFVQYRTECRIPDYIADPTNLEMQFDSVGQTW